MSRYHRSFSSNSSATVQISSNGELRQFNSPPSGSSSSAGAFLRMRFAVCTAFSAVPFDRIYYGELIA